MNRFTVVWWQFATRRLADLWLEATDKAAITHAADEIDRRLAVDPLSCAEHRHEELCGLTIDPLTVQFTIDDHDRLVKVWTVRRSDIQPLAS
jgi:hypothetical protein